MDAMAAQSSIPLEDFTCPAKALRDHMVTRKGNHFGRNLLRTVFRDPTYQSEWLQGLDDNKLFFLPRQHALINAVDDDVATVLMRPSAFVRRRTPTADNPSPVEAIPQTDTSFVMFISERKRIFDNSDAEEDSTLWSVEDGIMEHLQRNTSIHMYVVVAFPDKRNFANVIIARKLQPHEGPIDLMDNSEAHSCATSHVSPRAYRYVSISAGKFRGNLYEGAGKCTVERINMIYWGNEIPRADDTNAQPQWRRLMPRHDCYDAFDAAELQETELGRRDSGGCASYQLMCQIERAANDGTMVGMAHPIAVLPVPRVILENAITVRCTSYMSGNTERFYRQLFDYVSKRTGLRMQWVDPWQQEASMSPWTAVTNGDVVDVAVMCGVEFGRYYYAGEATNLTTAVTPLGAPVRDFSRLGPLLPGPAHHAAPMYTTVVVTTRDVPDTTDIETLRGMRFAYNEEISWSGYLAIDAYLRHTLASDIDVFTGGNARAVGTHAKALECLIAGTADFATIDAVVLDEALHDDPALLQRVRVHNIPPFTLEYPWPMPLCVGNRWRLLPWVNFAISRAMTLVSAESDAEYDTLFRRNRFMRVEPVTVVPYKCFAKLLGTTPASRPPSPRDHRVDAFYESGMQPDALRAA